MREILDLIKLDQKIHSLWIKIMNSKSQEGKLKSIKEYIFFLTEQYQKGSLGYMAFPYYITSLLALDANEFKELEKIIDLAAELEIPNSTGETTPANRLDETQKLVKIIENLK